MTGTVAARLLAQPFFAALTDTQRAALAEDGMTVTFTAGERLFDEGGIADRFWLIEQGVALDMRVPGRGDQDADPAFGYAMLRSFTPVTERLQATRIRLLDLYAVPAQVRQAEIQSADA
jgi:CRP/FNR family cyclic AMP-dependent transcriptional regulator